MRICVLGMSVKRPPGAGVGTEVAAGTKAGPLAAVCVCCVCGQSVVPENTGGRSRGRGRDGQERREQRAEMLLLVYTGVIENVSANNAVIGAGPMNGGDINALFLGHLAGERACEHP